ncbi:MAG: VOC family protein [Acidobacteria bacterium]|nr:MAG: VOC family protein [Acidobacteriota bacterium]
MAKITPFLWFDGKVEDAVHFYTSVFKKAHVTSISPMSATFEIEGQRFIAFNGGPQYKFTEAVSFMIHCATQEEVDYFWSKLTADGGSEQPCGWVKDKFGLSWQVIPDVLGRYLGDKNREKAQRVLQAMLKMKKIDIAALDAAYAS